MSTIVLFEEKHVRRAWDKATQKWLFAIVDVIAVLTESVDPGAYWRKLKERLKKDGNETVTNCHALKMTAADGKQRLTDVADTEQLLRLIQSIPSPKAEPFKLWLARVGYERLEESVGPSAASALRPRPREIGVEIVLGERRGDALLKQQPVKLLSIHVQGLRRLARRKPTARVGKQHQRHDHATSIQPCFAPERACDRLRQIYGNLHAETLCPKPPPLQPFA